MQKSCIFHRLCCNCYRTCVYMSYTWPIVYTYYAFVLLLFLHCHLMHNRYTNLQKSPTVICRHDFAYTVSNLRTFHLYSAFTAVPLRLLLIFLYILRTFSFPSMPIQLTICYSLQDASMVVASSTITSQREEGLSSQIHSRHCGSLC